MQNRFSNILTTILTLCALVVTGLVVRRELFSSPPPAAAAPVVVEDWQQYAATGSILGSPDAPLRVIEFSDFQCPFCARTTEGVHRLVEKYPGQVAVVYRHYPLEIHPHAFAAALAVECAGEQGRFRAYHDALFAGQDSIGKRDWSRFADDAGVADRAAFDQCVASERFAARVRRDLDDGGRAGVQGTPSFIFDGRMVAGAEGLAQVEAWIAARNSKR